MKTTLFPQPTLRVLPTLSGPTTTGNNIYDSLLAMMNTAIDTNEWSRVASF